MIKNDLKEIKNEEELIEQLFANKFYLLAEIEVSEGSNGERKTKTQHLLMFDFYLNERDQKLFRYLFTYINKSLILNKFKPFLNRLKVIKSKLDEFSYIRVSLIGGFSFNSLSKQHGYEPIDRVKID